MKETHKKIVTIAGAALLLGGFNAVAEENAGSSLYVHADAGVALMQNFKINGINAEMDPGARFDASVGYNLNNCWAVEFETGGLWNRFDKIGGSSISGGHLDLFRTPLLASVIYKINLNDRWTPYIGVGAGGDLATLDAEPDNGSSESDTGIAFAVQAQAGISYALSDHASVDLGYKFFGSGHHSWNIEGEHFGSSDLFTHAVLASFSWKF